MIGTMLRRDIVRMPKKPRSLLAAAAIIAGLIAAPGGAQANTQFEGVVLVPAAKSDSVVAGFKHGKIVSFKSSMAPGSIVIVTKQHALYYILGGGKAVKYPVATAKKGFEWKGTHEVSRKAKWPNWRPPATMRKRRPDLPVFMKGGLNNPLGARAIYLGSSIYRIHGTNEPASIGKSASSGCIRMHNADVTELFRHVKMGATVSVL
jgi:lipoprotein-anchoring transpeptidase ErfK/SrfK